MGDVLFSRLNNFEEWGHEVVESRFDLISRKQVFSEHLLQCCRHVDDLFCTDLPLYLTTFDSDSLGKRMEDRFQTPHHGFLLSPTWRETDQKTICLGWGYEYPCSKRTGVSLQIELRNRTGCHLPSERPGNTLRALPHFCEVRSVSPIDRLVCPVHFSN